MLDTVEAVKELASDPSDHPLMRGPDVIIACVRQGNLLNQALEMAKLGTHIVLASFVTPTTIDAGILLRKQLVLSGIMAERYGQNRIKGRISLHVLAQEQLDATPLLSGSDIQNAIGLTYAGEKLAVLLEP
jgi:threonine dehydrogenase-like Zn-dependent dehydrogenase